MNSARLVLDFLPEFGFDIIPLDASPVSRFCMNLKTWKRQFLTKTHNFKKKMHP